MVQANILNVTGLATGVVLAAGAVWAQERILPDFGGESEEPQSQLEQSYAIADYLNPVCEDLTVSRRECEESVMDVAVSMKDKVLRDFEAGASKQENPLMGILQGMAGAGTRSLIDRICFPIPEDSSDVEATVQVQNQGAQCLGEIQNLLASTNNPDTFSVVNGVTAFMAYEYVQCLASDATDCAVYMSSDEPYAVILERPDPEVQRDYATEQCATRSEGLQNGANCGFAFVEMATSFYTFAEPELAEENRDNLRGPFAVDAAIRDYEVYYGLLEDAVGQNRQGFTPEQLAPVFSLITLGPLVLERFQQKTGIQFPEGSLEFLSDPSEVIPELQPFLEQ